MPLEFDPDDPFPSLPAVDFTVAEARRHALAADRWLDLRPEEIERTLRGASFAHTGQELWLDSPVQNISTTYVEFRWMLGRVNPAPGSTVVDLGAGYSRLGFVIGRHYPEVSFVGYELVAERVAETRRCLARWSHPRVRVETVDLSDPGFAPCDADIYFMYDFGTRPAIEKALQDLKHIASNRRITVVGRGRRCRDLIDRDHAWLSRSVPPEHHPNMSIYRSPGPLSTP